MSTETKYFIRVSQNYVTHNSAQKQVSLLIPEINNILVTGESQFKAFMEDLHSKIHDIDISHKRCTNIDLRIYDQEKMHIYIPGVSFNWNSTAGYSLYAEGCFSACVHIVKKEI